eukprot:CAMPEP_0202826200 /NCGR_PEP_ID=MMETSP1389-20130828/13455_1 /ASSEMBLY_ACC=CAM_ASM_000865 /TAXON_ID=302021 /ORGANISM="Rhodomonas sp., Strain CCMP768" /LENGTH=30 /DNA_ID= /DNA_START= /DNA_END= /DNA_ORIENTATION=
MSGGGAWVTPPCALACTACMAAPHGSVAGW